MSDTEILNSLKRIEQMFVYLSEKAYFLARDVDGLKNHIALNGQTVVELKNGTKVSVPNQVEDVIQRIMVMSRDFYELEVLSELDVFLPKEAVILDIGANIGNHTLYWLSNNLASFVYAFEPIPVNLKLLKENLNLNNYNDQVAIFEVGLSDMLGKGTIVKYNSANRGGTVIGHDDSGDLELTTLDSLPIDRKIDFMKIDVEGFEAKVLKGGAELIKRDRPPIFIEIFSHQMDGTSAVLKSFDYQLAKEFTKDNYLWLWAG